MEKGKKLKCKWPCPILTKSSLSLLCPSCVTRKKTTIRRWPREILGVAIDGLRSQYMVSGARDSPPGGTNQILIRGGSARRSNPLPFYIPFWQKRYPFYIPFIEKRYPFHIPTLGSLVLIFM